PCRQPRRASAHDWPAPRSERRETMTAPFAREHLAFRRRSLVPASSEVPAPRAASRGPGASPCAQAAPDAGRQSTQGALVADDGDGGGEIDGARWLRRGYFWLR